MQHTHACAHIQNQGVRDKEEHKIIYVAKIEINLKKNLSIVLHRGRLGVRKMSKWCVLKRLLLLNPPKFLFQSRLKLRFLRVSKVMK